MACRLVIAKPGIFLIRTLQINFCEIFSIIHISIQENPYENIVCQMGAILSWL